MLRWSNYDNDRAYDNIARGREKVNGASAGASHVEFAGITTVNSEYLTYPRRSGYLHTGCVNGTVTQFRIDRVRLIAACRVAN